MLTNRVPEPYLNILLAFNNCFVSFVLLSYYYGHLRLLNIIILVHRRDSVVFINFFVFKF